VKSYRKELWVVVPEMQGVKDLTEEVRECVEASRVKEGLCLVNAMNVTSSIFINSDDWDIHKEFFKWLEDIAPHDPEKKADTKDVEEHFADVHFKRTVLGRDVTIAITKGELDLGTWEQILYFEFDGKRRKHVLVKIIGE